MNQYQARGLFGGATHRITHRRNTLGVGAGTGTGSAIMDRALGAGAGLVVGRRPVAHTSNSRMKEAEGKPLVDTAALKALLRLLRLAQVFGRWHSLTLIFSLAYYAHIFYHLELRKTLHDI